MHAHALKRESWLPIKVTKRNGTEVEFNRVKIENAILKAGEASGEFSSEEAGLLTAHVIKVLSHTGDREQTPGIERIQDIVEQVLISANHLKTARA
ncbi:MAG: hypothetical protein B6D79_08410, partial [gamma proteobacterium symbiont of Ctena orbiculata]